MTDFLMEKIASDMRKTATMLEEFSKMYDALHPDQMPWTAKSLRDEAEVLTGS